jgi:hypothetical protein
MYMLSMLQVAIPKYVVCSCWIDGDSTSVSGGTKITLAHPKTGGPPVAHRGPLTLARLVRLWAVVDHFGRRFGGWGSHGLDASDRLFGGTSG